MLNFTAISADYKKHLIILTGTFISGILALLFQNIIAGFAVFYLPILLVILAETFEKNYWQTTGFYIFIICLHEILVRCLGNIAFTSDGNPWASLFFYIILCETYIEIIAITFITRNSKFAANLKRAFIVSIIYLVIGIMYFFVAKPF